MASIIASTELVCHKLTSRDFKALVESNGVVGWKLLQRLLTLYSARIRLIRTKRNPNAGAWARRIWFH